MARTYGNEIKPQIPLTIPYWWYNISFSMAILYDEVSQYIAGNTSFNFHANILISKGKVCQKLHSVSQVPSYEPNLTFLAPLLNGVCLFGHVIYS